MIALLLAGLMAAATGQGTNIAAGERPDRAVMLVITPRSVSPNIPSSTYLDAAQRAFARETSLNLASAEQAGVDAASMRECPVDLRLQCWSKLALADERNVARYLIVLSLQPVSGSDRATLLMLDLERVRRVLDDAALANDTEAQEQRIFELALQLEPEVLSPAEDGATERFMEAAVARDLRDPLEESGHFRPYGQLEMRSETANLSIDLDGRIVGTTSGEPVTLTEILPGERTVSLRRADGWTSVKKLDIRRGETTNIEMEDPPSEVHPARPVVWVSGFAVAATGVAVSVIAAAMAAGAPASACLQREASDSGCSGLGTLTLGFEGTAETPSFDPSAVNPSGLLLAPLGIGLAAGGLATGLGTLLFGDEADFPWPQILIGLGTAGLTYGLGAALDAR